ncbi:hypothetical protein ATCC90586_000184 [Pythium insidiosum]|nr:hypothetical protein ATCC90586_000184 [Pythium insidiosum]
MRHDHRQHPGELFVQQQLGVPLGVSPSAYVSDEMPMQHALFFSNLLYFAICTLDQHGRVWSTILVGSGETLSPIRALDVETLVGEAQVAPGDPFVRSLVDTASRQRLWAGLGVDFANRRRNKVAGTIEDFGFDGSDLGLLLKTNENMGNCPKYITERHLVPHERSARLALDAFDQSVPLSSAEIAVIEQASTLFLGTRHITNDPRTTDLGLNHRGGAPGFVRIERNEIGDAIALIIPDFSGNRFYQSLGNIQTDGVVGLVIPCFQSGDLVHVTGTAENLFNEAAEAVMPRVQALTRITVTGHVYIEHALPLQMIGPEMLSPYNPPLRLLASELKSRGVEPTQAQVISARLTDVQCMSRAISAFTFELSAPVSFLPGSFAIFDFSRHIPRVYRHMNQLNPQQVNDDHIRTWTISSAPPYDALTRSFRPTNRITCTVKRVDGGAVTPFLHGAAPSLVVPFRGVGGAFSIYSAASPVRVKHRKMLWIAGGVGVTPFLSFANSHLNTVDPSAEVIVLFAARGDEAALGLSVFSQCPFVTQLTVFDSAPLEHHVTGDSPLTAARVHRRIELRDLTAIADLQERAVSLCGPPTFMDAVGSLLQRAGVASSRIDREVFTF